MPDAELKPNSESDVSSHLTGLWLAEEATREPSPLRKHRCTQCTPNSPSMVCCNMVGDRDMLCTHGACTQISCASSAASLSLSRKGSLGFGFGSGRFRACHSLAPASGPRLPLFGVLCAPAAPFLSYLPARRQGLGALGEAEVLVSSKKQKDKLRALRKRALRPL